MTCDEAARRRGGMPDGKAKKTKRHVEGSNASDVAKVRVASRGHSDAIAN